MKMSKIFNKEVRIGIAGIVALGLLVYGINYLKGINLFKPSSYFYVKFENVNGIAKSSPVYADGVRVGIVRNIQYDYNQPENVVVEVEVDTELRIPKGSSAELEAEMLGGVRMNLLLANNPREKHNIGDTITGYFNSGMMGSVGKIVPKVDKMIPKLDSILTSLNALLADPSIAATLHSVEKISANIETTTAKLDNLMGNDIPQLTHKLNSLGDNFVEISNTLKGIDIKGTFNEVDQTLANVRDITEKLNNKDSSIGLLINDTELYDNLNATSANAADLLKDLKEHPKRYVHFSLFGKKDK